MRKIFIAVMVVLALYQIMPPHANPRQREMVQSARRCLGDVYAANRVPGGPPPQGRGACTDVVYWACLPVANLQAEVERDRLRHGEVVDRDLDYRWCPRLMTWFQRHALTVRDWQPGDIVFWSDSQGVPYHTGVVSDRRAGDGHLLVIHNPGPVCVEDNALAGYPVGGHFRLR